MNYPSDFVTSFPYCEKTDLWAITKCFLISITLDNDRHQLLWSFKWWRRWRCRRRVLQQTHMYIQTPIRRIYTYTHADTHTHKNMYSSWTHKPTLSPSSSRNHPISWTVPDWPYVIGVQFTAAPRDEHSGVWKL